MNRINATVELCPPMPNAQAVGGVRLAASQLAAHSPRIEAVRGLGAKARRLCPGGGIWHPATANGDKLASLAARERLRRTRL